MLLIKTIASVYITSYNVWLNLHKCCNSTTLNKSNTWLIRLKIIIFSDLLTTFNSNQYIYNLRALLYILPTQHHLTGVESDLLTVLTGI